MNHSGIILLLLESSGLRFSVVLFSQSCHHNSQELLNDCLNLRSEGVTLLGSEDDGDAVSQELWRTVRRTSLH